MRVTREIKARIRRPGLSIGQLEALAGFPANESSRRAFWMARRADVQVHTGMDDPDPQLIFDRVREVCYKFIEWRVSQNEVSIIR